MKEIRCFLDEANATTTIVLVGMPKEKVHQIASDILGVAVENVSNLKSNGFANEPIVPSTTPVVAEKSETPTAKVSLNTDSLFKDAEAAPAAPASTPALSGEVVTNPIPEDAPADTSLLKAPAKAAPNSMPVAMDTPEPAVENQPSAPEDEMPVEEFKFSFGYFRNKTIRESLEFDAKRAFGYFKWILSDHVLANKTPNEDAFKKDVLPRFKEYFETHEVPQEDEVRDVAYVLLTAADADIRDDILLIFGYADIEEFYNANNGTNCADAIKMVLA